MATFISLSVVVGSYHTFLGVCDYTTVSAHIVKHNKESLGRNLESRGLIYYPGMQTRFLEASSAQEIFVLVLCVCACVFSCACIFVYSTFILRCTYVYLK